MHEDKQGSGQRDNLRSLMSGRWTRHPEHILAAMLCKNILLLKVQDCSEQNETVRIKMYILA